jgi:hypothetical protein
MNEPHSGYSGGMDKITQRFVTALDELHRDRNVDPLVDLFKLRDARRECEHPQADKSPMGALKKSGTATAVRTVHRGNLYEWSEAVMLTIDRVVPAPPSAVWDLLVDLEAWPKWGPSIRHAELDHPYTQLKLHATGKIYTSLRVVLPFVITEFDDDRQWGWRVAGVPATRHRVDSTEGGSRVTFDVPLCAAPYLAVCSMALGRINDLLSESPH